MKAAARRKRVRSARGRRGCIAWSGVVGVGAWGGSKELGGGGDGGESGNELRWIRVE